MKHEFSDRLRFCRRQRGLTQEQLAEAMGVSVAAVSKWELGQSVPELETLLELADFFDLSVDALLGFRLRDGGCQEAGARIDAARREKRYDEGAREAEMALQKYPNRFAVVYPAARLFHMAGIERKREPALRRALELLSHACRLLDQNSDPDISETSLRIEMADVLLGLGEEERAIAMLRANNPCGVNDEAIGCILAGMAGRREEAMPLLSMALLRHVTAILQIGSKLCNIYEDRGRLDQADEILAWLWRRALTPPPATGRMPSAGTRGRRPPWPTTAWALPPKTPSARPSPSRGRTRRRKPSWQRSRRRAEGKRRSQRETAAAEPRRFFIPDGWSPAFPALSPGFSGAYPSFSSSSTSSPKSFRAALTGAGLDISTPAIFSRLMGSVLEPPERNFL